MGMSRDVRGGGVKSTESVVVMRCLSEWVDGAGPDHLWFFGSE